ncbi:E3 SUMO-protein ligase ZBED1-like [Chaetodon trifascialis]|uniref:E3 SUMO-protein ligase ZBED1-like n=1 Tax=Chaetodon trifascialis TaxID=109706 RepID=UPI003991B36F
MAAPTEDGTTEFVAKKRTNGSIIWRYFGFKQSDEEQKDAFCRECKKLVPSNSSSTTNLFKHLQYHHKLLYQECARLRLAGTPTTTSKKTQQTTLQTSLPWCLPYEKTSARWVSITESIAFHIAKDMTPTAIVEQPGFIRMLKTLDPRYNLPSHHFFARQELPRMYTRERVRLAADLATVGHYALTTDMWSSRTCEPYMCVTIHYIVEWEIKSACLQTTYFPQDHTGENIAEAFGDVTTTWMLNPNPVAITTDNGSNIVSAVQTKQWLRMQCFGHRLHLAIGHGMQNSKITRAINVCKKNVAAFSYSYKKTRPIVLTWQDIEVLEAIQRALKPLQEFTDALSGEGYVTLSYVRPVLHLFNSKLLAPQEGDGELANTIRHTILTYLNEKYSEPSTSDLLDIASFVDPWFRGTYVCNEKLAAVKERVIFEAEELLAGAAPNQARPQSAAVPNQARPQSVGEQSAMADPAAPVPKKRKTLASFFEQNITPSTAYAPREAIQNELSSYMQSVCLDSKADPLQWWQDHEAAYPALSNLARKYLCVPATSSPSERIFSCSGNIVTCQRASLKLTQ